jgi:hypothetical protein
LNTPGKKILIISAWYFPLFHPRPHRWTAIAAHWAKEGCEVTVLTSKQPGFTENEIRDGVSVHRTGVDSVKTLLAFWKKGRESGNEAPAGWLWWIYQHIWKQLVFPDDSCWWYFPARRRLKQLLQKEKFDLIISVSLPFTGHLLGYFAKKQQPEAYWIADNGDPFAFQPQALNNRSLYGALNRRWEQRVLQIADKSVCTNEATRRAYARAHGEAAVQKMQCIPPLLHPAFEPDEVRPPVEGPIIMAYFGAMYPPMRTPETLLELVARLDLPIELHFWGEINPAFQKLLHAYPFVRLRGLHSRAAVREAMRGSHILVNIGNRSSYQLPSKAVEYLASGRPVLHLSFTEEDPFAELFEPGKLFFKWMPLEKETAERLEDLKVWINTISSQNIENQEINLKKYKIESIAAGYIA